MIKKMHLSISISKDLVDWIDQEIEDVAKFSSRSHAIEYSLKALRNKG